MRLLAFPAIVISLWAIGCTSTPPLVKAIRTNDNSLSIALLDQGVDLNAPLFENMLPLEIAAAVGVQTPVLAGASLSEPLLAP